MEKIICLVCDKELENWNYTDDNERKSFHPLDGLHFRSYGHYGSTVFDPMDGSSLDIAICDECLLKHRNKIYGNGKTEYNFG